MPRSLAERIDRASLSRTSVGKGSLGRFSVGTDISVSSAATRHWVNSVSDIYGPDEIEELLQDLNKLELSKFDSQHFDTGPQFENFDNFDIDGSKIEGLDMIDPGPASPLLRPSSPGAVSTRSWNSHTHYQQFKEPPDDYGWGGSRGPGHIVRPLQAAVCYCDINVLKTPRTLLRVLVLVTSVACLSSLVTSGTAKLGFSALPHFAKLRLILFVSLASALFSLLVIFLNISHLHALIPMDYSKMQTIIYLVLAVGYLAASSLVAWVLVTYNSDTSLFSWIPSSTRHHLITTTVLGYFCGLQTILCSYQSARYSHYAKIEESSTNFTLHDTVTTRAVTADSIMQPPSSHPPRPQPPPAPRPQQRSYDRERVDHAPPHHYYAPPPPVVHTNYSELVKQHNIQHNHNGGRQLLQHPAVGQRRIKKSGSRSPDRPLLPPVRSVSQHRLGTAEEMQDYYELRPRIPDLTEDLDDLHPEVVTSSRLSEPHNNNHKYNSHNKCRTFPRPDDQPASVEPAQSAISANYYKNNLVQNKNSSKVFDKQAVVGGNTAAVNDNGDTFVNINDSEHLPKSTSSSTLPRLGEHHSQRTGHSSRVEEANRTINDTLDRSDTIVIQCHTVHLDNEHHLHSKEPILNSNYHHNTDLHPELNSIAKVPNVKAMKDTGAIPKKKKPVPLPSPLTIHPDEIISVPIDDLSLSPNMSASTTKQQRYDYNHYAH